MKLLNFLELWIDTERMMSGKRKEVFCKCSVFFLHCTSFKTLTWNKILLKYKKMESWTVLKRYYHHRTIQLGRWGQVSSRGEMMVPGVTSFHFLLMHWTEWTISYFHKPDWLIRDWYSSPGPALLFDKPSVHTSRALSMILFPVSPTPQTNSVKGTIVYFCEHCWWISCCLPVVHISHKHKQYSVHSTLIWQSALGAQGVCESLVHTLCFKCRHPHKHTAADMDAHNITRLWSSDNCG